MPTFPPAAPVFNDPNLSASRFLQTPGFVPRRLQTLIDLRFIGTSLLTGRQESRGGAVGYELVEGIFADAVPEQVAPGAEYSLTTINRGPAGLARVGKWGKDTLVTDEGIVRSNMAEVERGLLKLSNSAGLAIDQAVTSVVASAVTNSAAAAAPWTGTGSAPKILQDVLKATAAVRGLNLGYNPNALLVDDLAWAYLASDPVIAATMARETAANAVYSGRFEVLAGLQVIHTNTANLPGSAGTNAWVVDTNMLGFIATENLGGGYQAAGGDGLVESKVIREEKTDAWLLRARANFAPVVTDPGAGFKITGIA